MGNLTEMSAAKAKAPGRQGAGEGLALIGARAAASAGLSGCRKMGGASKVPVQFARACQGGWNSDVFPQT